jgi:nucleotide-binding universal stress UspA family protein
LSRRCDTAPGSFHDHATHPGVSWVCDALGSTAHRGAATESQGEQIMYARVVVPLDGSELAEQALTDAEDLARLAMAALHLVRVVDPTRLDHFGLDQLVAASTLGEKIEEAERAATAYLEDIAARLRERDLTVQSEVRRGAPAAEIVAVANPGDLIVMLTHGRSGLGRWFLGSVAEAVVRQAPVPVLLVRARPVAPATTQEDAASLLLHEEYRPEELARLLAMDEALVRQAALSGRLHAKIADHHVLSIARTDALQWLAERT